MDASNELRELLAADAALMLGVAEAPDVAAALQRYWARREQPGVTLRVRAGAHRPAPPRGAGEDPRRGRTAPGSGRAATRRPRSRGTEGWTARSTWRLGRPEANLTRALSVMGVPIRAPLRTLPAGSLRRLRGRPGVGGMGIVYAALDTEMNRRVAFKMVRPHAERGTGGADARRTRCEATQARRRTRRSRRSFEQLKARLVQEAWVTGGLEHPGIVPVYEIGQTPDGDPLLHDALRPRASARSPTRSGERTGRAVRGAARPARAVPQGLRHAALRPRQGGRPPGPEARQRRAGRVRRGGAARLGAGAAGGHARTWHPRPGRRGSRRCATTPASTPLEGGALGTAGYMAPEAALGHLAEVDQRSDVYSLGAMLFEILTGRLPFEFHSFAEYASLLLREDPAAGARGRSLGPRGPLGACARGAIARSEPQRPAGARRWPTPSAAWQAENARRPRGRGAAARGALGARSVPSCSRAMRRLLQVDRAAAALAQVEAKRPGAPAAVPLRAKARDAARAGDASAGAGDRTAYGAPSRRGRGGGPARRRRRGCDDDRRTA